MSAAHSATWSRCRPPLRPHVWSEWRVTWAVLGLRERRCERCDKRQHSTQPPPPLR